MLKGVTERKAYIKGAEMSLYSVKRGLIKLKGKNRHWCSGRDMDHLADRTPELIQGAKDWYVGWQSIPVNN